MTYEGREIAKYEVIFANENKTHKVTVKACGARMAIDEADKIHFQRYGIDAIYFEIARVEKIA
jgi:hypothetical protein